MKISDKNHIVDLNAYMRNVNTSGKVGAGSKEPAKQAPSGEERVQLSEKARDIQKVKKVLDSVSDIRVEKVAQLKQSIEDGTYDVTGEEVARKMIRESLLDEIL